MQPSKRTPRQLVDAATRKPGPQQLTLVRERFVEIPLSKVQIMKDAIVRVEESATQVYGLMLAQAAALKSELLVLQRAKSVLQSVTGED